jgi:hypothetical protein
MYEAECWTLSRTNERVLDVFERKILCRIYSPLQDKGQWRSRYNKELYNFFKEPMLSVTIRIARLRWAAHVRRMDDEALPRRIMYVTRIIIIIIIMSIVPLGGSRVSSGSIVSDYGLDDRGSIPGRGKGFFL